MEYVDNEGKKYVGDVVRMPDGRILSGKTYTSESKRLHKVEVKEVVSTVPPQIPVSSAPATKKKSKKAR